MDRLSKIYIAGHRGLVGSNILRILQAKGYTNTVTRTSKELDLRRQRDVETFFEREQPEYVILAAAKVGGILANSTYKAEFIYDNIMIASIVINTAYKYDVKKLLNLGSSCIYPKFALQPMKEEYLLTGFLEPTNEPYAIAKIAAIKLCRYYNEQYGTNYISVMPTNLFGPNDNFNLETAHVLPALIRKFHLAKLFRAKDYEGIATDFKNNSVGYGLDVKINFEDETSIKQVINRLGITEDSVTLWGSGEPYREFLYVDDLAEACIFLMEKYSYEDIGEFINIGAEKDIQIRDLAQLIKDTVGYDGAMRHDLSKPDGMPRKLLDSSRIKLLGWEPITSLREGIKKTFKWYMRSCCTTVRV